MELKEISATKISPYRCYVRGNIIQTEGENVHTVGFKDGIAVVQVIQPDMQKSQDNMFDNKAIDLTKLKKIIVKIDPVTGKKYIYKDGRRIEVLSQITNPILNLKPVDTSVKIKSTSIKPTTSEGGDNNITKTVIINNLKNILNGTELPKLMPIKQVKKPTDNVKYHVLSVNVKKPGGGSGKTTMSTMTEGKSQSVDKNLQTDTLYKMDVFTQTDFEGEPPISELVNFILGENSGFAHKKMIDPKQLRTKEDINKFQFYNDMRSALNFDNSGNLPIHDSVMQNNLKLVRKNCVVLRAIRENVNILNQQYYAPLHLAVINNVDLDVVKVLLYHGADLRVTDPEGNTAIHLAIEHKRSSMLRILVAGAVEKRFNLDSFNYEGFTPLILACLNGSYAEAKLLLENGADPNVKDMKSGRTALFHAAECHDVNLVELLIHHKADTKIRNFFGTSPHDAMFELEDIPPQIKFSILGRDHQRFQAKKKLENSKGGEQQQNVKKAKLETTAILRKVDTNDVLCPKIRRK